MPTTISPEVIGMRSTASQYNECMERRTIQVRIFRGETKYVAESMDLPVVTGGDTLDETVANVREAIALHLDGEDLGELGLCNDPAIVVTMELHSVA
jgi:predicted RNase H-like HicB family nuclease